MYTARTLALIATALEVEAGDTTTANATEPGYWLRIATALEDVAGASTAANANFTGYLKRAAIAAEAIGGTSGSDENENEAGYLKRIVDALEVGGGVTTGSLIERFYQAVLNGGVGEPVPPSYMTVPNYASIAAFGDSITAGSSATSSGNRWTNILATALSASLSNKGIGGTFLQNSNLVGGSPGADNGRDRFVADLLGANKKAAVFSAYGLNDACYEAAPATMNVANFQNDYREIINGLIIGGYALDEIYLASPYYLDAYLTTITLDRAIYESYGAAVEAVAAEYGVNFCDLYSVTNTATYKADLAASDAIHPRNVGHAEIAAGWENNTLAGSTMNARTAPSSVTPTGGAEQITANCATVGSATSYEFVPVLAYVDGATTTDSDGSGAVMSSLAAGSYRVKARAVFGDGTKSPWTFAAADVTVTAIDVTAPVLSSPTDAANGSTGGTLSVSTNESGGTLYGFVSTSATPPSGADLKAGTGAVWSGNQAVSGTGVQNMSATGLTASTAYYAHFLHTDAAANDSNIASADGFTTDAPSAWVPTDFGAALTAWYDASDNATVTTDTGGTTPATAGSSTVAYFGDKSGNGNHLTQATSGNRPTYITDGLNSEKAVKFTSASSQRLTRLSAAAAAIADGSDNGFTIIAALRRGTPGVVARIFSIFENDSTPENRTITVTPTNALNINGFDGTTTGGTAGTASVVASDVWYVLTWVFTGTTNEFYVNAVSAGSGAHDLTTVTVNSIVMGAEYSGTAFVNFFNGAMGEMLLVDVATRDADVQDAETYLAAKWL